MATTMCFHLVQFTTDYVSKDNNNSSLPDLIDEKCKQNSRDGNAICMPWISQNFSVYFGTLNVDCIGQDCVSRKEQENKENTNTPLDNVLSVNSLGRFCSSTKLLKTKKRKRHAIELLKGIDSAKRKSDYNKEHERVNTKSEQQEVSRR